MPGTSFVVRDPDWQAAVEAARQHLREAGVTASDFALLFASHHFADAFQQIVPAIVDAAGAKMLVGCSGQGVIAGSRESEDFPALAVATMTLPGAGLHAVHLSQRQIVHASAGDLGDLLGVPPATANGWLVLADPFTFDMERLLALMYAAQPDVPVVGGMASGDFTAQRTHLFLDRNVFAEGAIAVALGGSWTVQPVVAQGAAPIGRPWTITSAEDQMVQTIGSRPALEVLIETLHGLPDELQARAQRNLLVGLAMDEYRDEFRRGDFLIRNLIGADRDSGAIAVGALPRVGQTLQFQVRDADAADDDLRAMLQQATTMLDGVRPAGALLCSCNGRGIGLFGTPDHDAAAFSHAFSDVPVAGFFCNGEIGPVAGRPYLHGFTASIGLIVPKKGTP